MRKYKFPVALLTLLLLSAFGCQRQPAPSPVHTDAQITSDVQAKLQGESALAGQNINAAVRDGVVTLSGSANDAASRALAGNDAGSISGVRTVVNNLEVQPVPQTAEATPPPPPAPEPQKQETPRERRRHHQDRRTQPPVQEPVETVQNNTPPPPPAPDTSPAAANTPPPPPLPPPPVVKTVTFNAGTVIPVRIMDPLDSATTQPNQTFHGTLAADMVSSGMIAIPQGTTVLGRVVDVKNAAHFKGNSLLSIEITRIDLRDHHVAVVTDTFSKQGAGRGKNTAEKAGGGALLGTLIGALAGGGKGAAIGAIAGAGAGTGINAATRGQQVQIPSETLVNFTLQSPFSVTTSRAVGSPAPANPPATQPALEQRPPQQ